MSKFKKLIVITCFSMLGVFGASNVAQAHLVVFGWKDNADGTVTIFGQHWHGDQTSAYSDNVGVHIGDPATDPSTWPVFPWVSVMNNVGGDLAGLTAMVAAGTLTGFETDPGNFSNNPNENDWFVTDPLVIGNGVWSMFTGTNCCVDTMTAPLTFALTGIISVPPGTGPGQAPPGAPEPTTLALLGLAGLGMAARRRMKA